MSDMPNQGLFAVKHVESWFFADESALPAGKEG
jgi:hypothetical protein